MNSNEQISYQLPFVWHVLLHCLDSAASCGRGVLGVISGRSLSWSSVTSGPSGSPRSAPGQTSVTPDGVIMPALLTHRCRQDHLASPFNLKLHVQFGWSGIQRRGCLGSSSPAMIPRTTGALPTQTQEPTKQYPTILCSKQDIGSGARGGVEKVRESEQDGGGTHRRHGDP